MLARANQRHREFPARKRIAGARDIHLIRQFPEQLARFRIFGQRQQRRLRDLHDRALGFHVESSDGFDQVAEQFDADRLRPFGRKNVQDAAAQRVFADHFHRIALLVADALQMRQQIFERDLLAHAQCERQLAIELGSFRAQQCRRHGSDGDAGLARGQSPKSDGPFGTDFAVRRHALRGQHVHGWDSLGTWKIRRHKELEERIDQLAERFGLFVAIHNHYDVALGGLP